MSKLFFFLTLPLLLFSFNWDYTHDFVLKKDEVAQVKVTNRADDSVRVLKLRWTLYENSRLVVLVKYDDFPTQYIIQKEYKRNSIKIDLRDDYETIFNRPYLLITFKDFTSAKARLKVSVSDIKKQIKIDYVDPKS